MKLGGKRVRIFEGVNLRGERELHSFRKLRGVCVLANQGVQSQESKQRYEEKGKLLFS